MAMDQAAKFRLKVAKTQEVGFSAIQKELSLENMIKNEEKEKEQIELNNLLAKIQKEKEKRKCLKDTIKEKDLDNELISEKHQTEAEIDDIKQSIAKKVMIKRAKLKKLIDMMRNKARLRRSQLEAELKDLRQKMAADLLAAQRSGDMKKCKKGKTVIDYRENYCNLHFVEDYIRNSDCKTDEQFCYMCCESEFGNMFIDRREKCYNMCDEKEKKLVPKSKGGEYRWVWSPTHQVKK